MTVEADIAWCDGASEGGARQIAAAKLHLLQLEPIRSRLGDKWERLSNLVHKLFEKTLRETQGPNDHFLLVDEMSYIVTFHSLTPEEAVVACMSVAKSVCELLFGAEINDAAVRGLVGTVPPALLQGATMDSSIIGEILERRGREIIIGSQSASTGPRADDGYTPQGDTHWRPLEWIGKAHERVGLTGKKLGFFPIWDLKERKSASVFLSFVSSRDRRCLSVRRALGKTSEANAVDTEIALLNAAAEYSHRIHSANKICAVGVGVSYQTLSGFHPRIAYINALRSLPIISTCPLLLRVEQVPGGTPTGRLAEIVTMLSLTNVRVIIEFESLLCLPQLDIRLGAIGLGGSLKSCDSVLAAAMVHRLARRAAGQSAFVFLHDIDRREDVDIAAQNKVRFGSGTAVNSKFIFSGEEPVPDFPLHY